MEQNISSPSTNSFEAISGLNSECTLPCISTTMRFSPERSCEKWARLSHFFRTSESTPQGIPLLFTYFVNSSSMCSSIVTNSSHVYMYVRIFPYSSKLSPCFNSCSSCCVNSIPASAFAPPSLCAAQLFALFLIMSSADFKYLFTTHCWT